MASFYAPNILTRAIQSDGVLDLIPAPGFNARIKGDSIGSLWADTRSTGALASDYSQFRLTRAGVAKWRMGNNLDGLGNDDYFIHRDNDGVVTDLDVMKITRSSGRVDFSGTVYSNGVLLSGGVPTTGGTFTGGVRVGTYTTATSTQNPISSDSWSNLVLPNFPLFVAGPDGGIGCIANTDGANTQTPAGQKRYGWFGMGSDNGIHMSTNLQYFRTGTSPVLFDPTMPRFNFGADHDGTLSFTWDPAAIAGVGYDYRVAAGTAPSSATPAVDRSNAPYTPLGSQSLVIYGQGYNFPNNYGGVDICTMRPGQPMNFWTSNAASTPYMALQVTAHIAGGAGNVNVFRQLVAGGVTGVAGIRLQNTGTPTTAAGIAYLWYDGTNIKAAAGLTVTTLA